MDPSPKDRQKYKQIFVSVNVKLFHNSIKIGIKDLVSIRLERNSSASDSLSSAYSSGNAIEKNCAKLPLAFLGKKVFDIKPTIGIKECILI